MSSLVSDFFEDLPFDEFLAKYCEMVACAMLNQMRFFRLDEKDRYEMELFYKHDNEKEGDLINGHKNLVEVKFTGDKKKWDACDVSYNHNEQKYAPVLYFYIDYNRFFDLGKMGWDVKLVKWNFATNNLRRNEEKDLWKFLTCGELSHPINNFDWDSRNKKK